MHIFYRPEMSVEIDSYSPSSRKPAEFVKAMLIGDEPVSIHSFEPVTKADLYKAHGEHYVDGIFALREPNGFGNTDPKIPPSTLYTIGSLTAAVLNRDKLTGPVCSPTSGFHHACFYHGGGFCTFNGLLVAAFKYLDANPGKTIGILDCDVHEGNGTIDILSKRPQYAGRIKHHTAGAKFIAGDVDQRTMMSDFYKWHNAALRDLESCDVVIYQAGADMHEHDPLGGYLPSTAMFARDLRTFRHLGDKVVWNLAGGYQVTQTGNMDVVIDIHKLTAKAAREVAHV